MPARGATIGLVLAAMALLLSTSGGESAIRAKAQAEAAQLRQVNRSAVLTSHPI